MTTSAQRSLRSLSPAGIRCCRGPQRAQDGAMDDPDYPHPSSAAVTRSMKGNVSKNTRPEVVLRALLREAGYAGYRLHWRAPGTPDIAYPGRKIAYFRARLLLAPLSSLRAAPAQGQPRVLAREIRKERTPRRGQRKGTGGRGMGGRSGVGMRIAPRPAVCSTQGARRAGRGVLRHRNARCQGHG